MESKTVMLVNTVLLTTFICEDINGTFIAFGGDLETEKILVFHRQPYYRYSYHISEMLRYQKKHRNCVFFFQPRALFQTSFVFERYLLVLILTRAIIIYSAILSFVKCSSRASAA